MAQNRFAEIYLTPTGNDVTDTLRWWWLWNKLALPFADRVVKLEDLDEELFADLLSCIGVRDSGVRARRAIASVSTSKNSARAATATRRQLCWSDIAPSEDKDRVEQLGASLGYSFA